MLLLNKHIEIIKVINKRIIESDSNKEDFYTKDRVDLIKLSSDLNIKFSLLFQTFKDLKFEIIDNRFITKNSLLSLLNFIEIISFNKDKFTNDISELPVSIRSELLKLKDSDV